MPRKSEDPARAEAARAFLKANEMYIVAGLQADALRASIRTALIAGGLETDPETVAYVAKRMVERQGSSLLDEIEALKSRARGLFGR